MRDTEAVMPDERLHRTVLASSPAYEAATYYEWLLEIPALADVGALVVAPPEETFTGWAPVFHVDSTREALHRARSFHPSVRAEIRTDSETWHCVTAAGATWVVLNERSAGEPADAVPPGRVNCDYSGPDVAAATRYLGRLLDLDHVVIAGDPFDMRFLYAGRRLSTGIFRMSAIMRGPELPYWIVYFEVADIHVGISRAVASGSRVRIPPSRSPFNTYAVLADPWGNLFGFSTMLDPADIGEIPAIGSDGRDQVLQQLVDVHPAPTVLPHS